MDFEVNLKKPAAAVQEQDNQLLDMTVKDSFPMLPN